MVFRFKKPGTVQNRHLQHLTATQSQSQDCNIELIAEQTVDAMRFARDH